MSRRQLPIRHALCAAALVIASMAAPLPSAVADSSLTRHCQSSDLRYPFEPGGPKTFGVFRLRISGATCPTAHRVARAWMAEFELSILLGRMRLPREVAGFRFETLPPNAAQTYRELGRKRTTTIRFDYRVPSG